MTILSDGTLKMIGADLIDPFDPAQIQPASYDLKLDLLSKYSNDYQYLNNRWFLRPKEFTLACTIETIKMHPKLVGRLEGKSSWARLGLIIHTAGFIDPGFHGQLVLEITNLSNHNIELVHGTSIAQICFEWLDYIAQKPYGHPDLHSHYQGQVGVAKSWMDNAEVT